MFYLLHHKLETYKRKITQSNRVHVPSESRKRLSPFLCVSLANSVSTSLSHSLPPPLSQILLTLSLAAVSVLRSLARTRVPKSPETELNRKRSLSCVPVRFPFPLLLLSLNLSLSFSISFPYFTLSLGLKKSGIKSKIKHASH